VKLAEAFGAKGILCSDPADLDEAIMEMLAYDGPVIFDCLVEKHENCFPMIPSGKAHNEMLLGDAAIKGAIDASVRYWFKERSHERIEHYQRHVFEICL
jgi:acetolactate synthase-1/2/3 large subunit